MTSFPPPLAGEGEGGGEARQVSEIFDGVVLQPMR